MGSYILFPPLNAMNNVGPGSFSFYFLSSFLFFSFFFLFFPFLKIFFKQMQTGNGNISNNRAKSFSNFFLYLRNNINRAYHAIFLSI